MTVLRSRQVMDKTHPSNLTIMSSAPSGWTVSPGNKKPKSMIGGIKILPEPRNMAEIRERTRKVRPASAHAATPLIPSIFPQGKFPDGGAAAALCLHRQDGFNDL
jgi:hypothetical protein